jgi:SAM-dependent methyltransferase
VSSSDYSYLGTELEIFQHATNWKRYWSRSIQRWISGDVAEVGAGIGANTAVMQNPTVRNWLCIEPDGAMESRLRQSTGGIPHCDVEIGTLARCARTFDCVLYIDVLEHIEDDRGELKVAAEHLKPNGRIVVLSPAHQSLFSPFDAAIGHYRRYGRETLAACGPLNCSLQELYFLDAVGMISSYANRMLLKQSSPSLQQILFWDRCIVPMSRTLDPLFGRRLGKTIIGVWSKNS